MRLGPALLLTHTAAAWLMVGFIWTVQVLHYPLFALVGPDDFPRYEAAHNARFALVAAPATLVVLAATVGLYLVRDRPLPLAALVTSTALLVVIIVSTVAFQAPAHTRLAGGFDPAVLAGLVAGNWVRTAAWTAVAGVDIWALVRLLHR